MGPQSCVVYRWDQKDPAKKPKKTADPTPAKDVYALGQLMHEVFIGGKFAHAADGSLDVSQIKSGDKVGRNDCLPFLRKRNGFPSYSCFFPPSARCSTGSRLLALRQHTYRCIHIFR